MEQELMESRIEQSCSRFVHCANVDFVFYVFDLLLQEATQSIRPMIVTCTTPYSQIPNHKTTHAMCLCMCMLNAQKTSQ